MIPVLPAHEIVVLIGFLAFAYIVQSPNQKTKQKVRWKAKQKDKSSVKGVPRPVPLVLLWSPRLDRCFLKMAWSSVTRHHMPTPSTTHSKQNYPQFQNLIPCSTAFPLPSEASGPVLHLLGPGAVPPCPDWLSLALVQVKHLGFIKEF